MSPEREKLIDDLFAEAVALTDERRVAFFEHLQARNDAAFDPAFIDELKALVTGFETAEAEGFLNEPLIRAEAVDAPAQMLANGQQFEGYEIVRLLGEGGMGEVYLAQDPELRRNVAIKLIPGAWRSKEALRRFRQERLILARLQHPNIAKLFAAVTTQEGVPFFVMEYVEGERLDRYAKEHALSVRERLRMFRLICSAVSYAHQNLVVHRDLKPGNILVTADGEPKLLDFGIAKLLYEAGSEQPSVTIVNALTPQYASPEQIKGEAVTTATDVYSLGVLLYELMTGSGPYSLQGGSPAELMNAVCNREPPKPSTRIAQTGVTPKALQGDLDQIILKALRKEPAERYASVEQLSEDIGRHLDGLPVQARNGTVAYRISKFVRRNAVLAVAASLVLLTLIAGIAATAFEARRADRRFRDVRQLAHSVLFDYHDSIAALPGATAVRKRLVEDGLRYLDSLSKDSGNDPSLLSELADAYEKVGAVQGGFALSDAGRTISVSNLGDHTGAVRSVEKALAIRRQLAESEPSNRDAQDKLGILYASLAGQYLLTGHPKRTVEYSDKSISILEPGVAARPRNEPASYWLVNAYMAKGKALGDPATGNLGNTAAALGFLNKARLVAERLAGEHPAVTSYQQLLGSLYNMSASLSTDERESLDASLRAAEIDRKLVGLEPENTWYRRELAVQLGNAGSSMMRLKDTPGALSKFREALAIYQSLVAADPSDAAIRRDAAVGYRNVGVALTPENRAEGMINFHRALDMLSALATQDPTNSDVLRQWAYTWLALSRSQSRMADLAGAAESARQGIRIGEALVADSVNNVSAQTTLAMLYFQLGGYESARAAKPAGDRSREFRNAAAAAWRKSLAIYEALRQKGTLNPADAGKPDEIRREIANATAH